MRHGENKVRLQALHSIKMGKICIICEVGREFSFQTCKSTYLTEDSCTDLQSIKYYSQAGKIHIRPGLRMQRGHYEEWPPSRGSIMKSGLQGMWEKKCLARFTPNRRNRGHETESSWNRNFLSNCHQNKIALSWGPENPMRLSMKAWYAKSCVIVPIKDFTSGPTIFWPRYLLRRLYIWRNNHLRILPATPPPPPCHNKLLGPMVFWP